MNPVVPFKETTRDGFSGVIPLFLLSEHQQAMSINRRHRVTPRFAQSLLTRPVAVGCTPRALFGELDEFCLLSVQQYCDNDTPLLFDLLASDFPLFRKFAGCPLAVRVDQG